MKQLLRFSKILLSLLLVLVLATGTAAALCAAAYTAAHPDESSNTEPTQQENFESFCA